MKRRQLSKQFIPFRRRCSNWGSWGGISPVWGLSRSPGWSWRPRNGAHMQSTHLRLTLTHFKLTIHRQSVGRAFSGIHQRFMSKAQFLKLFTIQPCYSELFDTPFREVLLEVFMILSCHGHLGSSAVATLGGGKSWRQLQLLITGTPRPLLSWFLTFRDNNSTIRRLDFGHADFLAFCPLDYAFEMYTFDG